MKLIANLIIILISINALCAQTPITKVQFQSITHDFGKIEESAGNVTYTFKYKNVGDEPLIIYTVGVSCGCTTPEWNKAPLLPGKEGEMKVTFDPIGRPGKFEKSINITCNTQGGTIKLLISGLVNPKPRTIVDDYTVDAVEGLRLNTRVLMWGNIPRGRASYNSLAIANNSDKELTVEVDKTMLPKHVTAEPLNLKLKPRERNEIRLKFDASKTELWGNQKFSFGLIANGVKFEMPIGNVATLIEDFRKLTPQELSNAPLAEYSSRFYHFSDQPRGAKLKRDFMLKNSGERDLIIRHIGFNDNALGVQVSKKVIKSGETATITITLNGTDRENMIAETVWFITNDPQNPAREIRVLANIK